MSTMFLGGFTSILTLSLEEIESLPRVEFDLLIILSTFSTNFGFAWSTQNKINKTQGVHLYFNYYFYKKKSLRSGEVNFSKWKTKISKSFT